MVIGPNGTGKSTILCAICLGLGGEPNLLGRASDIETFVANGEEEGEIEIEIVNTKKGGRNPVIRRQIRRNGSPKSTFIWNDQQVSRKVVRDNCLDYYQISVDNLCTFLPQDRVGSFSGFDSRQLLVETEKSLSASQHLYHTHQELIKDQEEVRGGNDKRAILENKLEQLKHEQQRLGRARALIEERNVAIQQADLLRKKIVWLKFDALIGQANDKKIAKAELKKQLREVAERIKPLEEAHASTKQKLDQFTSECNACDNAIREEQKNMEKQTSKYESHDDMIETIISELQTIDKRRLDKEHKVQELREKVTSFSESMANWPAMDSLKEEELQCRNDQKAIMTLYDNARREQHRLQQERNELEDEFKRVQTQLSKLQDEKARRKDRIYAQNPNLKKISDWIQSHRTEFRKEVVGPVMCEIATKSEREAAYLEQHVPNSTLKSFIVQCKEDYDYLYRNVRGELKVPINVLLVKDILPIKRMYSEQKMEILKREHGVTGYMDETFMAPDLVMEALKMSARIDGVLIGTERTQQSLDNKDLLNYLSQTEDGSGKLQNCCIFSSDGAKSYKYTSMVSKYSKKSSVRVDDIRPAKFLAPGVSDEAKDKVQAEFDALRTRRDAAQAAVEEASGKQAEVQAQAQESRAKQKAAREAVENLQRMINKLRNAEAKLKDAEAELSVGDEQEKAHKVAQLEKRIHHSLLALMEHSESYFKMMTHTATLSKARLSREAASQEERTSGQALEEATHDYRSIEKKFLDASEAFKRAKEELHRLKKIADEEAPIEDEHGNELPLKAQLEELPVTVLEEAQVALDEAEAKIESIAADQNVIREHERNLAEVEEVQSQLDDLNSSEERRRQQLDQKVKPWVESLKVAVQKVDSLFSQYMAEMGCTGEVGLTMGQSTEAQPYGNFIEWGIEIRVAFRENHKLQVLSARVQSGGERSVSTIMYLMALQDMMVAPFRCVDEINQGLDERNERLVFKRIVTNSTKIPGRAGPTDHAGQYFLITPKLLPNLYDMEVEAMTVLFIFNGPYNVKDPLDWNIRKLIELRKRALGEMEDNVDDENDSPNMQAENARPSKQRKKRIME